MLHCGSAAEDQMPGDFDGLRIGCRHRGVYEVSGALLDRLLRFSPPEREEALAKAKRFAGQIKSLSSTRSALRACPAPAAQAVPARGF
jgi:hypothetical protein